MVREAGEGGCFKKGSLALYARQVAFHGLPLAWFLGSIFVGTRASKEDEVVGVISVPPA